MNEYLYYFILIFGPIFCFVCAFGPCFYEIYLDKKSEEKMALRKEKLALQNTQKKKSPTGGLLDFSELSDEYL